MKGGEGRLVGALDVKSRAGGGEVELAGCVGGGGAGVVSETDDMMSFMRLVQWKGS